MIFNPKEYSVDMAGRNDALRYAMINCLETIQ